MDKINDKYGEFVITPALMMGMDETIIDRIAFGGGQGAGGTVSIGTAVGNPLLRARSPLPQMFLH
jgi:hypothetical protein